MQNLYDISINDYTYNLSDDKIANFPLQKRDSSKLLIWKDNNIKEAHFKNLPNYFPDNSLMIFNNTKVIQARMFFRKETGANIEIFCLEPVSPVDMSIALSSSSPVVWNCLIGNSKKWKNNSLSSSINISGQELNIIITKKEKLEQSEHIIFSWDNENICFGDILEHFGKTPLPPYIKRESNKEDKERYQTIYAQHQGSVAAPTAGLHYTNNILQSLKQKNISQEHLILKIGVGTFRPIKTEKLIAHNMHTEEIKISVRTIKKILDKKKEQKNIISVGTTTLRTLESLYWHGGKLLLGENANQIDISQWEVYKMQDIFSVEESLEKVLEYMYKNNLSEIVGQTQLMIIPGYKFKIVDILNTNFHQPKSTLLLLTAAFIGKSWKEVYDYAISHNFRFLSYGDSCLFFKK